MITLYEHPLSSYAMKVKIALMEKRIEFQPIVPDGMMTGAANAAFVEASPRAEIPALIDGDTEVFDSTIIMEYLEDKWPNPPLLPRSPADRARVRMIEDVMDCLYEPNNWGLGEVLRFKRATGAQADKMVAFSRESVTKLQGWLDRELGSRPWFNGDTFGWGDVACAPYVARSAVSGHPPAAGSALAAWLERVSARPSVAKAVEQMKQVIANFPDVATMLAEGKIKRQYRDHRLEWMIAAGGLSVVQEGIAKGSIRFSRLPE
ncbi:MAG: glutathione S-transferase family protein [Betaproteobacteria bacterium]|nr:glutathione S-transferase family protein [Betaproteobacteria bacterium]